MADDKIKPDEGTSSGEPKAPAQNAPGVVVPERTAGTPPPSAIPDAGQLAGADAEKASMVEQAKSRVAAVKESLGEKAAVPSAAAPGAHDIPRAPVKKKEEGPKPTDASENKSVKKLKAKFPGA